MLKKADRGGVPIWKRRASPANRGEARRDAKGKRIGANAFGLCRSDIHAARHLDALRIDPAIVLREQRGDHRADVVGDTGAAERSRGLGCNTGLNLARRGVDDLKAGRLVEVLPDFPPTPISVHYPRSRQLSPRVRVFVDWLVEILGPKLDAG
ncbi:DNA-binding transcriptional LysR family regulator [Mesorhizobium shonense]|uniref:DNA-binding transcriptional LysR family regulator n=1 Tax=Mesorhizobium shonense TaxID=1209948 RepID=A0ABV2I2T2_9HYPH